jgi:SurA N-terminal domain
MNATRAVIPLLLLLASCGDAPAPAPAPESAASAATPDPSRPLPLPLPEVVARVNGQEIRIRQILPLAKLSLDRVSVAERDKRKPEMVRKALDDFISRELLLQEALARGIAADTRDVDWSYDQIRGQYPAEDDWAAFLSSQGMDTQSFKAEVRVQATVAALMAREIEAWPVPESEARAAYEANPRGFGPPGAIAAPSFAEARAEVEQSVRRMNAVEIQAALLARLLARARIERYI